MRRTLLVLCCLIALVSAACAAGSSGQTVPDVAVETFDGETVSTHDFLGRPLVINFWASWCGPCVEEMPDFEQVHQQLGDRVRFLGIDTRDGIVPARNLLEETGITYEVVRDPEARAFEAFAIRGMPSTFIVAPDGEILARHTGPLTADDLQALIAEHLEVAVNG